MDISDLFAHHGTVSGIRLQCGIHTCPSKCHLSKVVPHSQILCQQIVEEHCPQGHVQARKCHRPSLPCGTCQRAAKLAEEKRKKEFELEQQRMAQQAEHDLRMKTLEDKIATEKQIVQDALLAQQRSQAVQQKEEDLKEAQKASATAVASAFLSPITSFFSSPSQKTTSSDDPRGTSIAHNSTAATNSIQPTPLVLGLDQIWVGIIGINTTWCQGAAVLMVMVV
jgi:hypothetical protein